MRNNPIQRLPQKTSVQDALSAINTMKAAIREILEDEHLLYAAGASDLSQQIDPGNPPALIHYMRSTMSDRMLFMIGATGWALMSEMLVDIMEAKAGEAKG